MITLGQPLAPDRETFDALVASISASGRWTNGGPVVAEFERALAADLSSAWALATASGTTGLTVALLACRLPAGGEVITSPLTFPATVQAIEAAGLEPVFAGVDPVTLNLDPDAVLQAIGPRTAAILPVHLFGVAADPALDRIAVEHGLPVVYDAAHAFGLPGVAERGTAAVYSLHATKLLHSGEGGVVTTPDAEVARRVREARNFGLAGDVVVARGTNAKLPEVSAALGLAVRVGVPREIDLRRHLRETYARLIQRSDRVEPHAPGHARALVTEVIRCDARDQSRILAELASAGVIGRRFPALTAAGQAYAEVPLVGADRAHLDALAAERIALPLHGRVTDGAVEAIARVVQGR
ncbi:aminotransferase class I/II-fold pyridoxal phosphate-dependent enzyme [Leucobacter rhizosphaerae]|uniref:Aminotransferase class I/II-fold pyridoxal phosphate-dependent enzyme n=1 Tax=Leucobacter rhizosphaerae TaxID=2932245 RepID=A0ABY4FUW2_9MICO|nr:aminotransferase class I/II-fold pyridoxal phosphate-dependent enzyme [Leucobacter rhizosphaerae]UOQ60067.1 aminotransferase class I/II-fold pyridoxal phosphate-dependent enzyme [Leucobacter rhizosphaerae]